MILQYFNALALALRLARAASSPRGRARQLGAYRGQRYCVLRAPRSAPRATAEPRAKADPPFFAELATSVPSAARGACIILSV